MIAASSPRPAMTRKAWRRGPVATPRRRAPRGATSSGSSVIQPTSMCRLRPVSATSTARSRSSVGSSRLRARRLPVPPGSRPIGTPVPTISWATARTVPSPPKAQTTSTPSARAARVWPKPTSCSSVSRKSGSSHPAPAQTPADDALRPSPVALELGRVDDDGQPLRGGAASSLAAEGVARGAADRRRGRSERDDSSSQSPPATNTTARPMPTQVHHASDTEWKVPHAHAVTCAS